MTAVVDTNVVAYFLLGTEALADEARAGLEQASTLMAPAHWEAELVDLAGGLAVHAEAAHRARRAPLHLLLETGMSDDQPTVVEHVMADQRIEPFAHRPGEFRRLGG